MINKKTLSERDICTKYITPAIEQAGWDKMTQYREEVSFTAGKIHVRGQLTVRGKSKRADYILYYKPNIPIAVVEAKDNTHSVRSGIQQALQYADMLDIPCVFSSNGDGFLFHDRTAVGEEIEQELSLDNFPSPDALWEKYKRYKGIETSEEERLSLQDYYDDGSGKKPRYYQVIAANRTVEAIAKGQNRILLVMATGTGKTYTAFQIVYRLWRAGVKKRILFLADRNILISQAKKEDFKYFRDKLTVVKRHEVDKSYEVYMALYQGLSGTEEERNIYKQFSPDFFDLIVVDECHRGSARDDSAWREILDYFHSATQIGLTATPKETADTSNSEYFGDPVYTYSLRQGIEDGFLAPYRVVSVGLNVDLEYWRPGKNQKDVDGNPITDRTYNSKDYDKNLVIAERTDIVAQKITEFLKGYNRYAKTIVFCVDIEHAERMRTALVRHNADLCRENHRYVMQITGDNDEGKLELDNFINPEETYPVIVTTSELLTTGVDAQTCKVIVLESNIQSMTKFKQIIGRGTRIREDFGKMFFTIMDFRGAAHLFSDSRFDGDPIRIRHIEEGEDAGGVIADEEENPEIVIDNENGEEIHFPPPGPGASYPAEQPQGGASREPRQKVYVSGVDVTVLNMRELHFDQNGKLITTSLKDHTRGIVQERYASLDEFLTVWNNTDRKAAILEELENLGVLVGKLEEAVDRELDLFDLICHLAYDQPPLTRRERANNVRKRNYFTKYGDTARRVLEALLDKYADGGEDIENLEVLKVQPLTDFGSPVEIVREFGGREQYLFAVRELEHELYQTAA